ncbi:MAG: hypothetical protein JXX14_13290, partial [Deltaproteobacteria bacterium]|nr:hypothetical protein [Deltaproteobacteria bacterium]
MNGMKARGNILKTATVSALFERSDWPPEKIAVEAAGGSHWAREVMYRQYAPFLINLLTRLSGSGSGVDDVVQDTFLLAFEKIGTLKDPMALKTWLCRIAINELRKRE